MSATKTNAMRILDKLKIEYQVHTYDSSDGKIDGISVAEKVGRKPEELYKTLVTKGKKDYFVFVIPVDKELNLKECAKTVGEKSVEMIPTADLLKVTGYIRGGCSPVGMKKSYVTVVDSAAQELETITFSGGKIGLQIELTPSDLQKAANVQYAHITE